MNDVELIENLRKRLEWAMSVLNHGVIPEPAHQGPCGPESGCDYSCMEAAHFYETLTEINRFLQANARAMTPGATETP